MMGHFMSNTNLSQGKFACQGSLRAYVQSRNQTSLGLKKSTRNIQHAVGFAKGFDCCNF